MQNRELIVYCDESLEKGKYFSHFYGGALISASSRESIENELAAVRDAHNLHGEMKWTKITANYKEKYLAFVEKFFDLIENGSIKVRIMFTQNSNVPTGLEEHQLNNEYFLLYYQLIKHSFGLMYCGEVGYQTKVNYT